MSRFTDCSVEAPVLERARCGDMTAHEVLYRTFRTPVFTLALRLVGRRDIAEEVLQETFVQVIRRIGQFQGQAPVGAWIRRIAVNASMMHLRSPWHRRARPLPAMSGVEAPGESLPAKGSGVAEQVQASRDMEWALAQLPEITRAVLILYDVEGYTHREIAELTGKTTSFSKSRLARGHQRLRELLRAADEEPVCMQPSSIC